ncbi:ankyrin repeat domain-containing protein 45 [Clupea harengus]|uniref:Ankyrin repeat domain-containing protein 45 n=1 Tax=Clupea harengus TaxID=7950 RepID=A0A6P8F280_CLUHA|nr:ankyrin repeat domain-containing protein 45 [Clupea harengus]
MKSSCVGSVYQLALAGDVPGIQSILQNERDTNQERPDLLWEKDDIGRNALFAASMLGRSNVVRELIEQGAEVNTWTVRGYSPLHYSALWGQLDTLKTLVELGADIQATNFRGERAKEVASRYSKMDCADYLSLAEAKQSLQSYITMVRETLADPEKHHGKLNKEDKNACINACTAKSDWILNSKNPTTQDFRDQRKHLEDVLSPIMAKLTPKASATSQLSKQ